MNELGKQAETFACDYLVRTGWTILARNYRAGPREIDIIARRAATVAFIEVKARQNDGAIFAISHRKKKLLFHAAQHWIETNAAKDLEYRFDAIAISWRGQGSTLEHIENAWIG